MVFPLYRSTGLLDGARDMAAAPSRSVECECCRCRRQKAPAIKAATPADGTLPLPVARNGDPGTSRFHGSLRTKRTVRTTLYQERGVAESWLSLLIRNRYAENCSDSRSERPIGGSDMRFLSSRMLMIQKRRIAMDRP
jgi:hypothetical protein